MLTSSHDVASNRIASQAKKEVILDTLKAHNGACTYEVRAGAFALFVVHTRSTHDRVWPRACWQVLFQKAEELHCDVLAAALKSLKKAKAVEYEGQMLLMPMCKDTEIKLVNPDYDPFAAPA